MPMCYTAVARFAQSLSHTHDQLSLIIRARKPSVTHLKAATPHRSFGQGSNETLLPVSAAAGMLQQCRCASLTAAGGHLQWGVSTCGCNAGLCIGALHVHEMLQLFAFTAVRVLCWVLCMCCLPDNLNTNILPALPMGVHVADAAHETCIAQHPEAFNMLT